MSTQSSQIRQIGSRDEEFVPRLFSVGHGTLAAEDLAALLNGAGITRLVDVRRFPGSRRHPHTARAEMERWLPSAGIDYRWEEALGGRRSASPGSPNVGLRSASFRAYADHMASPGFQVAIARLVSDAKGAQMAIMCSETLWWRCHRRLIADHLVLVLGWEVLHLAAGSPRPHVITDTARREGDHLVYDYGETLALNVER